MDKTIKNLIFLSLITLFLTLLVWLPHLLQTNNLNHLDFSNGFDTIYRNYDGIEYVIIAKTWYLPSLIAKIPQPLPASYYASHFPGYSIFIHLFSPFGYLKAMILVSLLFTIFSVWIFYLLVKDFNLSHQPFWLSVVFLVLPARWLISHSVGSSEPVFIFFTITTLYFFLKYEHSSKYHFLIFAGIAGFVAQLTRPPGILIFIGLSLYIFWKTYINKAVFFKILSLFKYLPLGLIPLSLVLIFYWFSISYGDFWAYFKSGDNIHLSFPPFQVFDKYQYWVGDIWLEDIVYIFILGFLGGLHLIKQKHYPLAFVTLTYLFASTLIAHRDIGRYILPIAPFILIAFEKVLVSKEFKIVLAITALAIYLYSQNYILENSAPIPNLEVYN